MDPEVIIHLLKGGHIKIQEREEMGMAQLIEMTDFLSPSVGCGSKLFHVAIIAAECDRCNRCLHRS